MIQAAHCDKNTIVDILTKSFDDNKSVNYIIKQDNKRKERIRKLMDYSFEVCKSFGRVLLSDDKKACALVVFPDKKRVSLKSILRDINLIASCTGLSGAAKAMSRERKIKKLQPKEKIYYLWFIGVDPWQQDKGIGSLLLREIIRDAETEDRPICLETSTAKNIPWYLKSGFMVYRELDLGYKLFFLKNNG